MWKIYIAYNFDNQPTSIVIADSEQSARAYWQGAGVDHHSERCIDLSDESDTEKLGYVTPILKTKEISCSNINRYDVNSKLLTVIKWVRMQE